MPVLLFLVFMIDHSKCQDSINKIVGVLHFWSRDVFVLAKRVAHDHDEAKAITNNTDRLTASNMSVLIEVHWQPLLGVHGSKSLGACFPGGVEESWIIVLKVFTYNEFAASIRNRDTLRILLGSQFNVSHPNETENSEASTINESHCVPRDEILFGFHD
jgi:hypothetical protein